MRVVSSAPSTETPIFVDLDGTLVRTDVLFETFLHRVKKNPLVFFLTVWWLARGGPALVKERLSAGFDVDAAHLPYNPHVLAYLREARGNGRRLYLATAAHASPAAQVAAHLGFFDGVIATEAGVNRKGLKKLEAIGALSGGGDFEYLGDSGADFPIWRSAAVAGIVDAGGAFAERAGRLAPASYRLGAARSQFNALLRAMRPHQWAKNLL
ncbi:MAG TPA: haloacid dehalogenase-like hydrolase, partial [Candidatus Baltobacteraceae bacterium]|nr:haloacid dehalogenase-like hydrolase [Candidatus Baltobacteraceae bacterium]